jgi:hypothetical protein
MKTFLLLFILAFSISSCNKTDGLSKNNYEYFNAHLKPSMTYAGIVNEFGEPIGDLGSGIHIYYYNLDDASCILIGYTDHIMYARHMSSCNLSSAQLLHTII